MSSTRIPRKLDAVEIRVLGTLLEKEQTTPEACPLSVNALLAGCNQKTNREPVMELTESQVVDALERLRQDVLVWRTEGAHRTMAAERRPTWGRPRRQGADDPDPPARTQTVASCAPAASACHLASSEVERPPSIPRARAAVDGPSAARPKEHAGPTVATSREEPAALAERPSSWSLRRHLVAPASAARRDRPAVTGIWKS